MPKSNQQDILDVTRIEMEARKLRADFIAQALRNALAWLTDHNPMGKGIARG